MIRFYGISHLIDLLEKEKNNAENIYQKKQKRNAWVNIGGQLIEADELTLLKKKIRNGKIKSWQDQHREYDRIATEYDGKKRMHAIASLFEITRINPAKVIEENIEEFIEEWVETKRWILDKIFESRAKDFSNEFRKMPYNTVEEMTEVLGSIETNNFIQFQEEQFKQSVKRAAVLKKNLRVKKKLRQVD